MTIDNIPIIRDRFTKLNSLFVDFFNGDEVQDENGHAFKIPDFYSKKITEIKEYWATEIFFKNLQTGKFNDFDASQFFKNEFISFYKYCIIRYYERNHNPTFMTGRIDPVNSSLYEEYPEIGDLTLFADQKIRLYNYLQGFKSQLVEANILSEGDLDFQGDKPEISSSEQTDSQFKTTPQVLCIPEVKIVDLYHLLNQHKIIHPIDCPNFMRCFDLNNIPPVKPTYFDGKMKVMVYALSLIMKDIKNLINDTNAKSHFGINNYKNYKSEIKRKYPVEEMLSFKIKKILQ